MDKRKVIDAYRRGFLTPQECAQVLGVEKGQLMRLLEQPGGTGTEKRHLDNQPASGN
ncbi:hypothetical protein LBW89_16890 [Paenibacillus sp. alder61]|uniref:hypothetical protein n=1 Tax=Paenibacillus TaxID=44249 RepID=UPI001479757D|nr:MULTISPECIES: hypothetical protein [Paenibacillus]MCA1294690.1 hypothetical protein [Paenibacillus sp. alder61]